MPAKVMVSRTDHTPGQLRELARKHRFRDRRRRMRAIALVMEDGLSRTEVACGTPPGRGTAEAGGRAPAGAEAGLPAHVPAARPPEGGPRRPGGIPKGFRPVGAGGGARRRGPGGCARLPAGRGAGGAEGHAVKGPGQEGDAPARRAGSPVRTPVPVPPPPAPRRATRSGMSAAGPTPGRRTGTSGRSGSGSPPESAPWWSPAGRAGTGRGIWGYRTASPCSGCRPRPGAQSGRDGVLGAEHRHFANRVSGSGKTSGRWSSTSGTPSSAGRGRSRGSPRGNGRCREIRDAYRQ